MTLRSATAAVAALALIVVLAATGNAAARGEDEAISARVQRLTNGADEIGDAPIRAREFLLAFYEARQNRPAWHGTDNGLDLLAEIDQAVWQGFRPGDFHLPMLMELDERAKSGEPDDIAAFDVVATDAAARLVHHIVFGKVDPQEIDPEWNFSRPVIERDPVEVLSAYVDGDGFSALMDQLAIGNLQYLHLVDALSLYREIDAHGGWPEVPAGPVLKPGDEDDRVPVLRDRLAAEGDFLGGLSGGNRYDPALVRAVEGFQTRHGLLADGIVGPNTLRSLNRTAADRVDQLRLSLERFRWFVRTLEDSFVLVNIGGARLFLVLDGEVAWTTRTITGSRYRRTPVFRDDIKYMEFNPTWSVPASIFRKDKLDKIRSDLSYLERNNFVVRDPEGQVVPASSVDWRAENPRVSLMQKPGSDNALGLVKFMFPNRYSVYLHDTNDRSLFDRTDRNLSSGCVRVEDPFVFAGLLMRDDPDWTQDRMQSILESGKTTRVDLPSPMPVMLTYWTAWVEDGRVQFREDPYERDQQVLEALNAPF